MKAKSILVTNDTDFTFGIATASLIAAALFASPIANATDDANNPLHPGYYAARAAHLGVERSPTHLAPSYVDDRNPLHPAFARAGSDKWQPAVITRNAEPYVDRGNPLHPAFARPTAMKRADAAAKAALSSTAPRQLSGINK